MKNRFSFTIRIHQDTTRNPILSDLQSIEISNITLISKPGKFQPVCMHNGNQRKFGYTVSTSKKFSPVSGSHSYPNLSFKGDYIDILVKNFPRYPVFTQDKYAVRNCLNGYGYTNYPNKGFPKQLLYRKIEILDLKHQ